MLDQVRVMKRNAVRIAQAWLKVHAVPIPSSQHLRAAHDPM